jgi:hypothetical protein
VSIAALIDSEVMTNLSLHGCVKHMDAYALHMLKTSQHPLMRARREWMRREALRQCLEAEREQKEMNKVLAGSPVSRGASVRRAALLHPYYAEKMRQTHNASWNDKDFVGSVRRDSPALFPKREST